MDPDVMKQPLKMIEIPLIKFNEEVIPYHQKTFEQHKVLVLKLVSLNSADQLRQEIKNRKREVKQLKDLMYELDSLRAKVYDSDLDTFDFKTLPLRKIILGLVTNYADLEKKASRVTNKVENNTDETATEKCSNPFEGAAQIQLYEDLNEIKLRERQGVLELVEDLHKDVEDLHEVYTHLHGMVETQGEHVNQVEQVTENTLENTQSGLKSLVKAHKLKVAAYPAAGAVLGGIIGGPIGSIAGLKVGSLAALCCAVAGYTGGKYFKRAKETEITEDDIPIPTDSNEEILINGSKKQE